MPTDTLKNISEDIDICTLLNTYMYLDYKDADNGGTLSDVLNSIKQLAPNKCSMPEYKILEAAINDNPNIGKYVIGNQSWKMGANKYNSGTSACTFTDPNTGDITVVFRGTGDGEWMDNALGMVQASTPQQEQALEYFDEIMMKNGWTSNNNITITGHSKGGNKAQYITLNSVYGSYIDKCYSIDGQGFSPEAIEMMKDKYGESAYYEQLDKMYSICGENDYVNELGEKVISDDHTIYIKTPVDLMDFAAYHDIKYLYYDINERGEPQFGSKINEVTSQGDIGKIVAEISAVLMRMPADVRRDAAFSIMQLFENKDLPAIGGEQATLANAISAIINTGPQVVYIFLSTKEGRRLLEENKEVIVEEIFNQFGLEGIFSLVASVGLAGLLSGITLNCIKTVAVSITYILEAAKAIIETVKMVIDIAEAIYDTFVMIYNDIRILVEQVKDWYNNNLNKGYKYATENPYILVNTNKLRDYADRLAAVNSRIDSLDRRLNSLYSRVSIWDWWTIFKVDALTGYSMRLLLCTNYLNDTAADFEAVERRLLVQLEHA